MPIFMDAQSQHPEAAALHPKIMHHLDRRIPRRPIDPPRTDFAFSPGRHADMMEAA